MGRPNRVVVVNGSVRIGGVAPDNTRHEPPEFLLGAAPCASTDADVFFPAKGGTTLPAKRVCRSCPFASACLAWALRNEQGLSHSLRHGVYGGLSVEERIALDRQAAA